VEVIPYEMMTPCSPPAPPPLQKGCSSLLKGDLRESRANLTEADYQKIFCSNMMSSNQETLKDGLNRHTQDIFIENSLRLPLHLLIFIN